MQELTREELIERLDKLEYTLEGMREDVEQELGLGNINHCTGEKYLTDELASLDVLLAIVRGEE